MSNLLKHMDIFVAEDTLDLQGDETKEGSALASKRLESKSHLRSQIVESANTEAEAIITIAKKKAAKIIEEANEIKKTIFEEAKKQGYEDGYEEGKNKAHEYLIEEKKELTRAFEAAVESIVEEKKKYIASSEQELIDLTLSIGNRIFGQLFEKDEAYILKMINKALANMAYSHEVCVCVCEENYNLVKDDLQLLKRNASANKVMVEVDHSLDKNDCLIKSTGGYVDASYARQIKRIENELKVLAGVNQNGDI